MITRRKSRILVGVLCLFVCILALTGCQGTKKYEKIDIVSVESLENVNEDTLQDITNSQAPLSILPEEEAPVETSSTTRELTTSNGFTDVEDTIYITSNQVNVRSECIPGSQVLAQLNQGESLKRTGYNESWTRVLYNDQEGYISSQYVSAETSAASAESDAVEAQAADAAPVAASQSKVVVIDAGHQAKGNSEKEPVGPGSSTMKAKVAAGATGVATGLKEYELNLMVSKKLKRILEERGYQVIMIRESHDVNISNAERAEIANKSGASIFIRVHGNSLDNSSVHGVLTMCQTASNPYNGNLHASSYSLSKKITDGIASATGAKNRGVQETDSMSGINWCKIPVSIVEMGFMSNVEEDKNMADDAYQEKIAQGIANGVDAYFAE